MSKRLAILILSVVFLDTYTLSNHEIVRWIHSPRIAKWGNWGHPEFCPINSWVGGMTLKIESSQGWSSDDTALNAVQLHCVDLDWIHSGSVTSTTGSWGNYRKTKYCTRGFATGYQLRSEKNQAKDFKLKCTNFDGTMSYVINSEYELPWGRWSQERSCPYRTAVCGLSTQVEKFKQGGKDDTSLNNVDLACCKIPDPVDICEFEIKWETVAICSDATEICNIKFTTGIEEVKRLAKFPKFYAKLGFVVDLKYVQKKLVLKAKTYEVYSLSGKSLKSIISKTKIKRNKISLQIHCEGISQQLIVTCGSYKVYTNEYRFVPNGDRGKFIYNPRVDNFA